MRVFVYGAGAVGCFVGGMMASGGCRVVLIGRAGVVAPMEARGLTLHFGPSAAGGKTVAVAAVAGIAEAATRFGRPDLVVVAMKAFGTAEAASALSSLWGREGGPCVLSVQNGIGNEEALAASLGADRVIAGALTVAVSMSEAATVRGHQAHGGIALAPLVAAGPAASLAADAAACLRRGGLEAAVAPDWRAVKWSKLLLNLLGNATCAVLDLPPEAALAHPGVFRVDRDAFCEAARVVTRLGIPTIDLPGYPVRLLRRLLQHLPAPWAQRLLYPRVAGGRGGKIPSLLADLRQGRARTEVSFLHGAVSRRGRLAGVATPVNDLLEALVAGIAAGSIPWDAYRGKPEALVRAVYGGTAALRA